MSANSTTAACTAAICKRWAANPSIMMKLFVESNSFAFAQAENFKTYSRFVLNRQILRPHVGICFSNLLTGFGFPCSSSERLDLIGRIGLPSCPASTTVALPYMLFEDKGGTGLSQPPDVFPSVHSFTLNSDKTELWLG